MALHPNSLANLKPARKGEVRNPSGANGATKSRERELLLVRSIDALDELDDEELRQQAMKAIACAIIERALQGDTRVLCRLLDRMWPV